MCERGKLSGALPPGSFSTSSPAMRTIVLAIELSVRNDADFELPYGLGLRPFFPMAAQMG